MEDNETQGWFEQEARRTARDHYGKLLRTRDSYMGMFAFTAALVRKTLGVDGEAAKQALRGYLDQGTIPDSSVYQQDPRGAFERFTTFSLLSLAPIAKLRARTSAEAIDWYKGTTEGVLHANAQFHSEACIVENRFTEQTHECGISQHCPCVVLHRHLVADAVERDFESTAYILDAPKAAEISLGMLQIAVDSHLVPRSEGVMLRDIFLHDFNNK